MGMTFAGVRRLALDIEKFCAEGFRVFQSGAGESADRIISIAVMDYYGYAEVLFGQDMGEAETLTRGSTIIREQDPDVIEGHNIFRFDLEYIRLRAARHGVKLLWGRDGSEPRVTIRPASPLPSGSSTTPAGTSTGAISSTHFLLLFHDVAARDLESFGLKNASIHFGLASPDRYYLDREKINDVFRDDPVRLRQYNLDDVRETLALSRLLSLRFVFLQTQIFPWSYQNCVIRGAATRINIPLEDADTGDVARCLCGDPRGQVAAQAVPHHEHPGRVDARRRGEGGRRP